MFGVDCIEKGASEIARSNALTNTALTYIKTINVHLRISEMAEKTGTVSSSIKKELGLIKDDDKKKKKKI